MRRGEAVTHTGLGSPGVVPSSPLKDLIISMRKWSSSKILPSIICFPMPRLRMLDTVNLRVVLHSSPMEKNRPGQPVRNVLGSGTEEPPTPHQTGSSTGVSAACFHTDLGTKGLPFLCASSLYPLSSVLTELYFGKSKIPASPVTPVLS